MKITTLTIITAGILLLLSSVSAQAQRCDVPAKKGTVYIVVKFRNYDSSSRNKTRVRISWGPNKFDREYPKFSVTQSAVGVIIAARHNSNDSVPLFIETNGTLEMCRQQDRAPSKMFYQNDSW